MPWSKERQRAYAQQPEVKERKRAQRRDPTVLMRRLELDRTGVDAIAAAARSGARYIDIACDWLIEESEVSALMRACGIARRPRRPGGGCGDSAADEGETA